MGIKSMKLPPNVKPIYIRKQQLRVYPFRILSEDTLLADCVEGMILLRYVPDPDHQSSLDYLAGI